jgi:hypothetical protein
MPERMFYKGTVKAALGANKHTGMRRLVWQRHSLQLYRGAAEVVM